jgi:hypothetical protein
MPVSLSKVLISFFILWHRWVTQPGQFAKCQCCSIFFLGTFIIFCPKRFIFFLRHLYYFSEIIFISALSHHIIFFHSALISYHSAFFFFHSIALLLVIIALLFNFSKCKQALIFYSGCKPALIFYSSKYETVSNFCFKTISWSYFSIILWIFWICFKC